MERADKNIDDLLETLHTTFHRIRQAGIDEELFDVIAGFEALSTGNKLRNLSGGHGKTSARIGINS
jgi:F-type H+-transporting ATPase subunit gamma